MLDKKQTIILKGNPISTNGLYRSHCKFGFPSVYMTPVGRDLKEVYQWTAKSEWKRGVLKSNVEVESKLYFKAGGAHDIDNYSKILLDALTGVVWEDDKQITKMTVEKFIDKINPRIEITIIWK